ncbi:MAG: 2'-5' RNA ligase [Desulfovibrio sp. S3730MH75]|nr:MAG: 2'-5' RNA ligase [Desulfovibrio sp. S3730MH75]
MQNIRTFIAHPVPEEWKNVLLENAELLNEGLQSKIAWVKPENMHFTLKFSGDIPEDAIPRVDPILKAIRFDPFEISTGPSGYFPSPIKPRVIWIGLTCGSKEICDNALAINNALAPLGFAKNTKPYHAHLTLGRVKKQAKDNWAALSDKIGNLSLPNSTISEFTLFQSELTPAGPIYTKLKTYTGRPD